MKEKLCFIVFLLIGYCSSISTAAKVDTTAIHLQCMQLASMGDSILRGSSDSVRMASNIKFREGMDTIVKMPASFQYSFAVVKNLSALTSDDDRFRIYTWMVPTNRGMKYEYFGYVQVYNEEKKSVKIYKLREQDFPNNETAEFIRLTDSTWYGALYYKIVHKRYDKKDQYMLLGWKGKDVFTTRKVIDNIAITPSKVEFGKPVIKGEGKKAKSRIILEYNASANVSVKYNEEERMIVYDHLSSSDPKPESKGMFALYGPDLTYDGLKFKNGFWFIEKDVQIRNTTDPSNKKPELNHDLRMQRKE